MSRDCGTYTFHAVCFINAGQHITSEDDSGGIAVDSFLILIFAVYGLIAIAIMIHFIKEDIKNGKRLEASMPAEMKYESSVQTIYDDGPMDFENKRTIDVNVRSRAIGKTFIMMIDGKESGKIGKQLSFIETHPGLHDLTIVTDDRKRRLICAKLSDLEQYTKITVFGIAGIYWVRIKKQWSQHPSYT